MTTRVLVAAAAWPQNKMKVTVEDKIGENAEGLRVWSPSQTIDLDLQLAEVQLHAGRRLVIEEVD
jgi:hypothetical protein